MKKRVKKQAKIIKKIKKSLPNKKKKNKFECVRIPSGIKGFDKLIEGGFEKNSTNLLVGGPGSGKTILATQFIVEGLKNGESCLYITFEESKQSFYHNMKRFSWQLEEYEKKGLFTFLNYTPGKVKSMLEEGGGIIESIIINNKITRLVIDSMTSFTLLFEDELEKREASLDLFNMIKKWNCTSLITFEGSPEGEHKVYRALEFESDSIILMQFIRKIVSRERYIEILKMRGTNHSKGLYRFSMTKKGVELSSSPVKSIKGI
ncbi:MAG: RAD55 family ATPase [Candidatus Pacearchaeota archaeon]